MIKKASYNDSHIIVEMAIQMCDTHTIDNFELILKKIIVVMVMLKNYFFLVNDRHKKWVVYNLQVIVN